MILKSSDKLIAIIGVVILIVAGIGIFIYIGTEDDSDNGSVDGTENKFKVEWIEEFQTETLNGYAGRDASYAESIGKTIVKEPVSVLTNIEIRIVWEDSRFSGIFFRNGLIKVGKDTLKAEFTYDGETKTIPAHEGMGNKSEQFTVYDKPSDEILEDIGDYYDAVEKIKQDFMDMDNVMVDTKVMITPGEGFGLRPLKLIRYILDKGENFMMEVTYTYCYPVITQVDEEEPPTDINPSGYQPPAYSKMCLPGML
jgi:hypothetical protein